jgi:hypothetical protein
VLVTERVSSKGVVQVIVVFEVIYGISVFIDYPASSTVLGGKSVARSSEIKDLVFLR